MQFSLRSRPVPNRVFNGPLQHPLSYLILSHDGLHYTLPHDPNSVVVFTDGCCRGNHLTPPSRNSSYGNYFAPSSPLNQVELLSPFEHPQTNQYAETYAVSQALLKILNAMNSYPRILSPNAPSTVIVVLDSNWVFKAMTQWAILSWEERDGTFWDRKTGKEICNGLSLVDLDTVIRTSFEEYHGIEVKFWWVKREWNEEADRLANSAFLSVEGRRRSSGWSSGAAENALAESGTNTQPVSSRSMALPPQSGIFQVEAIHPDPRLTGFGYDIRTPMPGEGVFFEPILLPAPYMHTIMVRSQDDGSALGAVKDQDLGDLWKNMKDAENGLVLYGTVVGEVKVEEFDGENVYFEVRWGVMGRHFLEVVRSGSSF